MTRRVYNFGPGPATLPLPVMERARDEFLDFQGLGASIIEISHRSKEFEALLDQTDALLRELMEIPQDYAILYAHGGGQMQFSMVPMNLMRYRPARKALYVETGEFSKRAIEEARRYGTVDVVASSRGTRFDRIPELDPARIDPAASYLHITTNNTICGTQWRDVPAAGDVPLVGDATSEILSRRIDVRRFGVLYAGAQKNLGPAGLAVVIVRRSLLGHELPETPKLLTYKVLADDHSLTNTTNTFSVYMSKLVLEWLKTQGGVPAIEVRNQRKAATLYAILDASSFYRGHAHTPDRSIMNVTFNLPTPELEARFLREAEAQGLYALKGHRALGGVRASLYNAMSEDGVAALADFMRTFEQRNG
ncbi:MAG: 3-phosphoserine/phosphohydroxythreonine transaminase [Candidatus Lambdaproteobacteria bacterium]|nr:3-phosphoserine/phosphohydroxythreonine transaminase [Candidatus Lambdaproteobacteria bacterium]